MSKPQKFDIITHDRRGNTRTKTVEADIKPNSALVMKAVDLKTEQSYINVSTKFDKSGKLTAIEIKRSRPIL